MRRDLKIVNKASKKSLIQCVAVFMAVCYTLSPLHNQIGEFLHHITHELEAPDYVLGHEKGKEEERSFHTHKDMGAISVASDHDHAIIDFVETLLEGSNQQDQFPDEKVPSSLKIDKHFCKEGFDFASNSLVKANSNTFYLSEKLHNGFSRIFCPPPI